MLGDKFIYVKSDRTERFPTNINERKTALEIRLKANDQFNLNKGHAHESVGELSSIDNHPADEGTELLKDKRSCIK